MSNAAHSFLTRLLQRLPSHLRETRIVLMLCILVLAEVSALMSVLLHAQGLNTWLGLMFSALMAILILAFFRGLPLNWTAYGGALLGGAYLFAISLREGAIYSSTLAWVPLLPLGVFYFIHGRAGRLWMLLAALMQCLMAVATWKWGSSLPSMEGQNLSTLSFIDYALASLALFLVPFFYQRQFELDLRDGQLRQLELQAHQGELERTAQMREHFIAMVSHELRTPMNAILGLNALLLDRVQDKPQATRVLAYTRQSADHLMTVINDVLDYSQFNSGQLTARLERFELHTTVRAAFDLFLPRIENTRLRYVCEIDPDVPKWVQTDRHRLMQVLVNLLGNAVKFTHVGRVCLRVGVQDAGVVFEVQDTGIGIAPNQQQKIFQRFGQADTSIHQRFGGSGLGLTISQKLVQMLGGHMGLESHEGAGSRFWFWLPLQAVDAMQPVVKPLQETPPSTLRARKFLVVDDHPVNRLLARQALLRQWPGSQVEECENGEKALLALEAPSDEGYDLVLMDMVMPVMDGIEATQRIRRSEQPRVRATPVLGLTANVNAQDLTRFEQAGLNAVLFKPYDLKRLREEVARLLSEQS